MKTSMPQNIEEKGRWQLTFPDVPRTYHLSCFFLYAWTQNSRFCLFFCIVCIFSFYLPLLFLKKSGIIYRADVMWHYEKIVFILFMLLPLKYFLQRSPGGWRNGLISKGAHHQGYWPEFHAWAPRGGGRELILPSFLLSFRHVWMSHMDIKDVRTKISRDLLKVVTF